MESPITFKGYKINNIQYETRDSDIELTEDYKPEIEFNVIECSNCISVF